MENIEKWGRASGDDSPQEPHIVGFDANQEALSLEDEIILLLKTQGPNNPLVENKIQIWEKSKNMDLVRLNNDFKSYTEIVIAKSEIFINANLKKEALEILTELCDMLKSNDMYSLIETVEDKIDNLK